MRAFLTSLLVSTGLLLTVSGTALADKPSKTTTTTRAAVNPTRTWSGRNGNWETTGTTRYTRDNMRFSIWNSRNRVTGETRSGVTRNGAGGYSSTSIGTQNRAGQTTSVKNSYKSPGQPRKKEGY